MPTFTYSPSYSVSLTAEPRIKRSRFGDGYEQRVSDGINIVARKWSVEFSMRYQSEIDPIVAFLNTQNAIYSFDWTPPYGAAGKWVCDSYALRVDKGNMYSLSAVFREVFEP